LRRITDLSLLADVGRYLSKQSGIAQSAIITGRFLVMKGMNTILNVVIAIGVIAPQHIDGSRTHTRKQPPIPASRFHALKLLDVWVYQNSNKKPQFVPDRYFKLPSDRNSYQTIRLKQLPIRDSM
jgi:hypothetical protein